MFGGGFIAQWGSVVIDAVRAAYALDAPGGLRFAFSLVLALDVLTYGWFAWGWRRHAPFSHAAVVTPTIPRT
jgi:hypothetical protein